ncbi:MAG: tRNA-dependent cyclodipeptide synthase [Bdellovibrionales bacterium]
MKNTNNQVVARGNYKIILRHAMGWQRYASARLQISVPSNPTFDPRTRSILNWVMQNFNDVTLCLHDTIQRYNLMSIGLSPEDAYKKALNDGDLWLKANVFSSDVFIDVVRWDSLLSHPRYPEVFQRVCALYENNKEFSEAVDHDLNEFAQRCLKRGEEFGSARLSLSRNFLLEEISGYVPLYQDSGAADIHPGMRMKAMELLSNGVGGFCFKDNLRIAVKTFDIEPSTRQSDKSIKMEKCAA